MESQALGLRPKIMLGGSSAWICFEPFEELVFQRGLMVLLQKPLHAAGIVFQTDVPYFFDHLDGSGSPSQDPFLWISARTMLAATYRADQCQSRES